MRRAAPAARLGRAVLAACLAACALPSAASAPPRDAELLAHAAVDAAFVPDPGDPRRDLVTGRDRDELEAEALRAYRTLAASDPERFAALRRRVLGADGAEELDRLARDELADGRRVAAELAWQRLVDEHPDSPLAGPALLRLASGAHARGDRLGAARRLNRLAELDLETAARAAPLMQRLLEEVEGELEARGPASGRDVVRLHGSIERLGLDRARELAEWTSGWGLVEEVARGLRLETSGDVLRRLKNLGADALPLDKLVRLVPREERVAGIRVEEQLRGGASPEDVERRVAARTEGRDLDGFEDLSRMHQLQVLLLARSLADLELEPAAFRLGDRTLNLRRQLVARIESLARRDDASLAPEERAVRQLLTLADANGDGRLTPLHDDEGIWRPKRFAVEADMRNAVTKGLDDDNPRAVADLFERTGLSEKALFHSLVRATLAVDATDARGTPRVSPALTELLLERLADRGRPVWGAAHPGERPRAGAVERDYLARLNVLRRPGEGLDDVVRRLVLGESAGAGGGLIALASEPRAAPLVAELAALGTRHAGAWLYVDDPPSTDGRPGVTAREKFARAQAIRAELDDLSATLALESVTSALVSDLESQGLRFRPEDLELVRQTIQREDLGTLAFVFDQGGLFSSLDSVLAFTQPGTSLGRVGPGHLVYGFGLDVLDGRPGANLGWRGGRRLASGTRLRYHVGATGLPLGVTDTMGVAARFRERSVWQPEVGLDASVLRGLAGRGFVNLIRDVNVKHQRRLAALFSEHEAAKAGGRRAFLESVTAEDAPARPAVLFARSLGHADTDFAADEEAFLLLHDSYEFERARQRSELHRGAWKVRFAGIGFDAALFAGDVYFLAGPLLALKDFRLFSHHVGGAERLVQSEEAVGRRVAVAVGEPEARGHRTTTTVDLLPTPDAAGHRALVATRRQDRRSSAPWEAEPDGRAQLASLRPAGEWHGSLEPDGGRGGGAAAPGSGGAGGGAHLNRFLARRGVPLELRPTEDPRVRVLAPVGLSPWASHSIEIYASRDEGLGLAISEDGLPLLVAPESLAGLTADWMEEVRAVTRAGEADSIHRVTLSLGGTRSPADIIEGSARFLRAEVVDGRVVGTARLATRYRGDDGETMSQANVLTRGAPDHAARLTALSRAAAAVPPPPLPEPPAVALRPPEPPASVALSDPAALDPRFLDGLRRAQPADIRAFKARALSHARRPEVAGHAIPALDPDNVAFLQSASLAAHGRPLAGRALEHAHFVLTHEGLFRADGGPVARQVAHLGRRAVTPFAPGRELEHAPSPRTRRLMELAGVDARAALDDIQARVRALIADARTTGRLRRDVLPAGTRVVTASQAGETRGVQWTTAPAAVEAHLVDPFPLSTNTGRYVAALGLGPDLPALFEAMREELAHRDGSPARAFALDADLVPAVAAALREPEDDTTLVARLGGLTVTIALAHPPRAGALARCKNATIFPPAYGAKLERTHEAVIAGAPVVTVGTAEADNRFAGESWAGWRRLGILAGLPLILRDRGGTPGASPEPPGPEPEPLPPREGRAPPGRERPVVEPPRAPRPGEPPSPGEPRDGSSPPGGGRSGRPGPPDRPPRPEPPSEPPAPRDGVEPPAGGRGRPDPPGRPGEPDVPQPEPPRDGEQPPADERPPRPGPPDPPDRPRRPVD